jgi:glycosyltransferase involved in cell wall biosynthesis
MNNTAKHIVILCSRLDLPGGIERAIINTANLFVIKGNRVTLLVLDKTKDSFYPLNNNIKIIQQSLSFGITQDGNIITRKIKLVSDVLALRKILKSLQADIIIATEYPFAVSSLLAGAKKKSKLVPWEHHHFKELHKNFFWDKLFTLAYPKLQAVVCLNKEEELFYANMNTKPVIIPNFIDPSTATGQHSCKIILTVARLAHVKGIDLLLQTAKIVLPHNPAWQWKIIGTGEMKEDVMDFIEKENLQNKLILQEPVSHNIKAEYQAASVYVMTSMNECFPMVLLEALSNGLPCIAFDCETGPRHIITNNEDGLLVEKDNPEKLSVAISSLINDEEKRKKMGSAGIVNMQRFSPDAVYKLWEEKILTL